MGELGFKARPDRSRLRDVHSGALCHLTVSLLSWTYAANPNSVGGVGEWRVQLSSTSVPAPCRGRLCQRHGPPLCLWCQTPQGMGQRLASGSSEWSNSDRNNTSSCTSWWDSAEACLEEADIVWAQKEVSLDLGCDGGIAFPLVGETGEAVLTWGNDMSRRRGMRVTCAFREQCAPGRRPDCSRCCQCRSPNSKGKNRLEKCVRNCFMLFPTDSSSTLIHYFLFVSFSFVCHAVFFFFFRTMLQLQEVRAWVSMKDTL